MFDHKVKNVVDANWAAATRLISDNAGKAAPDAAHQGSLLLKDVSAESVMTFLSRYSFHSSSEMGGNLLADYVRRQVDCGKLVSWNVAVISRDTPHPDYDDVSMGFDRPFHPIGRSRVVVGAREDWEGCSAYLKAITSTPDFTLDLDRHPSSTSAIVKARNESGTPLLLIYPIAPNSKPASRSEGANAETNGKGEKRVELDAVGPLVGLAMSLPAAAPGSEPKDMMHVDLGTLDSTAITATSDEDIDEDVYVDTENTLNQVSLDG